MIGQIIAHFRVTEKLGAGGMGEVYRATDSRLGRDVALKILPQAFATDQQRMARFEREAQLLAALNHPHIATIHGLEVAGATRALVMELVEGPTLADRIAQGPLPLDEALSIARQMAEALEYAHERGIIHRDLKPANVKLTHEGKVKLLDFGLAKALDDLPSQRDAASSPTLSAAATQAGIVLGTAAYMSPEQARGKPVDRRTDIWAYGVVLYEMLSGKRLFLGETAPDTLAHVITQEPKWDGLPAGVPLRIRRLLERCLTKDPKQRLRDIGEARIAIEEYGTNPSAEAPESTTASVSAPGAQPAWRRAVAWVGMALFAVLALLGFWRPWPRKAATGSGISIQLNSELGAPGSLFTQFGSSEVLSPDGTRIVYVLTDATGKRQLYLRALDQLQATALSGTEAARDPFFSPDGEWIAFFAGGKLKKISVRGGAAVTLCDAAEPRGGSWGDDGTIVFSPNLVGGLFKVSSAGGVPEPVTKLDPGGAESSDRWPQFLPGGKAVLFTASGIGNNPDTDSLYIQELPSGPKRKVYQGGYYGSYVPSGHVVFVHEGSLFAAPFDLKRLEIAGQAVPVLDDVVSNPTGGAAQYSISQNGTLAYLRGKATAELVSIEWMGRDGKMEPLRQTPGDYYEIKFSPDGKRLAMEIQDGSRRDIWSYDWKRDTLTRLTFGGATNITPVWTPDGQRITYGVGESIGIVNLYWKRADGAGEAQRLTQSQAFEYLGSWSPDGKVLAFSASVAGSTTGWDIYTLTMEGSEKTGWKPGVPKLFLGTPATEGFPVFSPDGRWIAYNSNESGTNEVYVRPFPGPGGKWQISSGGGYLPQWSRASQELFYRTDDQKIMFVTYTSTPDSFQAGKPALWSEGQFTGRGVSINFAPYPDGKRFAVLKAPSEGPAQELNKVVFVFNFFDELRQKLSLKK